MNPLFFLEIRSRSKTCVEWSKGFYGLSFTKITGYKGLYPGIYISLYKWRPATTPVSKFFTGWNATPASTVATVLFGAPVEPSSNTNKILLVERHQCSVQKGFNIFLVIVIHWTPVPAPAWTYRFSRSYVIMLTLLQDAMKPVIFFFALQQKETIWRLTMKVYTVSWSVFIRPV